MKIYAIKDTLIDYYMQPFAGRDDKDVLAAVSQAVSAQGNLDAIAQTPHHFQIWQLGEVDEEGHITAKKELVAECRSLIRSRIRNTPENESRAHQDGEPHHSQQSPLHGLAHPGAP